MEHIKIPTGYPSWRVRERIRNKRLELGKKLRNRNVDFSDNDINSKEEVIITKIHKVEEERGLRRIDPDCRDIRLRFCKPRKSGKASMTCK